MKSKQVLIMVVVMFAIFFAYKQGRVNERTERSRYYRSMAEARTLEHKRKMVTRMSRPLIEYAFLEIRDMLNN